MDSFRLDGIVWDVGPDVIDNFVNVLRVVVYFFPLGTLGSILGLVVSFTVFRIVIRLIKTIWDLLPFI